MRLEITLDYYPQIAQIPQIVEWKLRNLRNLRNLWITIPNGLRITRP